MFRAIFATFLLLLMAISGTATIVLLLYLMGVIGGKGA